MASYNRQSYLATIGNLPVKSSGEEVITKGDSSYPYNVRVGELVVWNPRKNVTLSDTDIATADHISIAVGVGDKSGTLAKELVHLGGNDFNLCDTNFNSRVTRPKCSSPQVVDVFFDCTECSETYSVVLRLNDSRVRSEYGFNGYADYSYEIPTECHGCDECDETHNCEELSCSMVKAINDTNLPPKKLRPYFQADKGDSQYKPFKAVRLFKGETATKEFCLTPQDGTCEDCNHYEGITGITIDGTSFDFSYTTAPGDVTKTLPEQLDRIIDETNKVLESIGGYAVLNNSQGKCCETGIQINSCATNISFNTDEGSVTACNEYDPYVSLTKEPNCVDCDSESIVEDLSCGFRIIVDAVEEDCDCDLPPNERIVNYWGRTVDVEFTGDGWNPSKRFSVVSQEQQLPEGLGIFYQDKAHYGQSNAGAGRNFRNTNRRVGRIGLPDENSRATNATNNIQCEEAYCIYSSEYVISKTPNSSPLLSNNYSTKGLGVVLIPKADSNTKNSWEDYLKALNDRGICTGGEVQCDIVVEITGTDTVTESSTTQLSGDTSPSTYEQGGTWSSSNEAVATVDQDGLVTGVSAGTSTITFTNSKSGISDTLVVTVTQ